MVPLPVLALTSGTFQHFQWKIYNIIHLKPRGGKWKRTGEEGEEVVTPSLSFRHIWNWLIRAPSCNFDLLCTTLIHFASALIQFATQQSIFFALLFSCALFSVLTVVLYALMSRGNTYHAFCWHSFPLFMKFILTWNALNWIAMPTMHRVQCIVQIVSLWRIRSGRVASLCFWWLMAARSLCATDYQMPWTLTHRYEIWKEKYKTGQNTNMKQITSVYISYNHKPSMTL